MIRLQIVNATEQRVGKRKIGIDNTREKEEGIILYFHDYGIFRCWLTGDETLLLVPFKITLMGVERISISFWQTRYLIGINVLERRFLIKKKIFR